MGDVSLSLYILSLPPNIISHTWDDDARINPKNEMMTHQSMWMKFFVHKLLIRFEKSLKSEQKGKLQFFRLFSVMMEATWIST